MQIVLPLCVPALNELVPAAGESLGLKGDALAAFLVKQVTTHARKLGAALRRANQQTWAALEIALAGPAWCEPLEKAVGRPEDQDLAAQVRVFLNAHPLPEFTGKTRFRQQCWTELRAARQAGRLVLAEPSVQELAGLVPTLSADDADGRALRQLADAVKAAGHGNLAWFLAVRPPSGPPLPAQAARTFFRGAIQADKDLLSALAFARLDQPGPSADPGLQALGEAFLRYGQRLGELLGDAPLVPLKQPGPGLNLTLPGPAKAQSLQAAPPKLAPRTAPLSRPPVVLEEEPIVLDAEVIVQEAEPVVLDALPVNSPRGRPVFFAPVRFTVQVESDPGRELRGAFPARVQSTGLALQPLGEREILVPVRSRAEALGDGRFAVDVKGRQVRFLARKFGANTRLLAEDVVRFLKGQRRSLSAGDYGLPGWLLPAAAVGGVVLLFLFVAAAALVYVANRDNTATTLSVASAPRMSEPDLPPPPPVAAPVNRPPDAPPPFVPPDNPPPFVPPPPPPPDNPPPPPMPSQMKLVASNLGQFLSWAADPRDKAAFVCYKDGTVRYYSYPDFGAREIYHIKGQAYQAAVDPNKGLLYAVVAKPNTIDPHPYAKHRVQALGDLHVYDIKPLLQNKANAAADLQPVRVIPLAARVPNLYVSDDGRYVYFLDATDRRNARLRRLDANDGARIEDLKLADGMEVLRVSPDDPTRMVAASSNGSVEEDWSKPNQFFDRVQVIDAANLTVVKTITIKDRFYDMALAPGGRAFLSPIKDWGAVSVLSLETGEVVARWDGFQSEDFVVVSRNGKRLYREKQFGSPIGVECWALPDDLTGQPVKGLQPQEGTEQDVSRGEMSLTPDGKRLLFKSGTVFELLNAVD